MRENFAESWSYLLHTDKFGRLFIRCGNESTRYPRTFSELNVKNVF
jgi:hypothetical protein